jgi:hypothetical protein
LLRRKREAKSGKPRAEKFFGRATARENFDATQKCR